MTKSSLARVRWQVTLVEHEPTKSPGWKLVDDIRKLSDEVHEVELLLESRELQKADFEDFSKQEDKLKVSCSEFSSGTKLCVCCGNNYINTLKWKVYFGPQSK